MLAFDLATMRSLLGRGFSDPEISQHLRLTDLAVDQTYGSVELKSLGVSVVFQREGVTADYPFYVSAFHLHAPQHSGYAGYGGDLPFGVGWGLDPASVRARASPQPELAASTGGKFSRLLGRNLPSYIRFAWMDGTVNFQFSSADGLELVTLYRAGA